MKAMNARRFTRRSFQVVVMMVMGLGPFAIQANGEPTFVAGDLIVKFITASEPGKLVKRAVQGDKTVDRELTVFAARLSMELGAALIVARVTSGNELVLSVNREQVVQSLRQAVTRDPAVRSATRTDPPKTVLPATRIALALDLRRDSDAGRLVSRSAGARSETSKEIETLVNKLCLGVYPQPTGRVSNRGQLILTIDIAALTLDLVERLKRRPDVEYAQLSQIVKPYPGASP